jgi:hypothetical protein
MQSHDTFVVSAMINLNGISSWKERGMISLCQERIATLGFDVTDLKIDDWKKVAYFQVARRIHQNTMSGGEPPHMQADASSGVDRFWIEMMPGMSAQQIHDFGVLSYSRDDGIGTIRAGWALWKMAGLSEYQADDFLNDGYRIWINSPWYNAGEALQFLTEVFEDLEASLPSVPENFSRRPEAEIMPIATHYARRNWAGCKLILLAEETNHADIVAAYVDRCYRAVILTPVEFVAPAWFAWATSTAETRGDALPWGQ